MSQKRKRDEPSDTAALPASKKSATEEPTGISAAERRQKRSERKSKKAQDAKTHDSRDETKNKDKSEPKSTPKSHSRSSTQTEPSPKPVQADGIVGDNIADGKDFVSLTDSVQAAPPTGSSLHFTDKKAKRASPRSERKKARAQQAESAGNETEPTATDAKSTTDPRFIVFVGNLPFNATTEQISSHFRKLTPTSIRHPTDKAKGRSKGYAFLEFDNYSSMKTCLKVYHHSMFDPERTAKLPAEAFDENGLEIERPGQETRKGNGRRINCELTAGGGGKSEGRKEKIRVKNTRLEEQRDRRRETEKKAEIAKRRKNKGMSDANAIEIQQKEEDGRGDIHPSRLKRVKA